VSQDIETLLRKELGQDPGDVSTIEE